MANDLVFGVKIDLQKGVEEALKDGDKALERIEKLFGKHPITIKLRMDNRVARGASAELTGFKKQLAELTQQWNSLTAAERGSAAGAAIREKFRALRTEAQGYTSTLQAAVKAEDKMRESHSKTAASANKLSSAYHNQSTYLSRLIQRMAVYAGVSHVGNFLTNVREVTAQFELQRISLGAIIQDQQRANQLFEEIKTFALKSPVKILDLTKYTKQLAAYKIGVDELFDTTKRLTDISVGLGVSMDRIVLMYGQIRATGYLRASEVRQATEAGIPLVEELAAKLTKANGELVTAADVMDMISKRAISFDMVKDVFTDMTSAGGIFYNMQEKQGNTLFGMWQKLGDAAAMMYDQIGNTSSVNEGMKMAIQTLRYLMLHWKQVGIVVGGVSVYILANTIATKNNAIATAAATTANKLHIMSLQQKLGALRLEQMNLKSTAIFQRLHTAATISATKAQIGAATSTNVFSKALYGLKAALLSNPLTALAAALTTIIALLMQSEGELDKLNRKLQDIDRDYDASGKKSVDRFKELVKAVEENVDGSKAQKEALDELDRTYSKILGSEALEFDSLKALGGQYGELIDLIEAYNAKKKGEERATAIKSSYATILDEEKDDLMDYLNAAGMSSEKQIEFMARLDKKLSEYAGQADAYIKATNETFQEFADDISQIDMSGNIFNVLHPDKLFDAWGIGLRTIGGWFGGQGMYYLYNYANAVQKERELLEETEIDTRNAVRGLDEYADGLDNVSKAIKNLDWSSQESLFNSLQEYNTKHPENMISVPIDLSFDPAKAETEYDKMLESSNMRIHAIFSNLQSIASQEGVTIPEKFYKQAKSVVEGNKDFSFIDFDGLAKLFTTDKAKNALKESKLLYESIAPSDDTIRMFNRKFMTLADNMDVSLDKMQKYLMKSGENLGEHRKRLSDEVTNLLKEIARLEWTKKLLKMFGLPVDAVEKQMQESKQTLTLLQSMISTIPDIEGIGKKKGGRKSDPRLQTLQEIANKMAEVNKEYDELLKKEGQTKALADTQKLFASSFKQMQSTAKKYKFKLPAFEVPQTIEDVQKWYKAVADNIKRLNLKNADKVLIELGFKSDKAAIDKQQKEIEKQLNELSDRISRTKTAKEFYEKILGMTGDYDLATKVADSIFGQNGDMLQKALAEQVRSMTNGLELPDGIISPDNIINYKRLGEFAEQMKKQLGEEPYKAIKKIAEEGQKDLAKTYEGYLKDLEKAKTYSDKRIELARTTAEKIREIDANVRAKNLTYEEGKRLKQKYSERETIEDAKNQFDEYKESELYLKIFSDLDNASTTSLRLMKKRLDMFRSMYGNMYDPTQLKELQEQAEKIEEQLSKRNPFKALRESFKKYKDEISKYTKTDVLRGVGSASRNLYDASEMYGAGSIQAYNAEVDLKAAKQLYELHKKMTDETGKQLKGRAAINALMKLADINLFNKSAELDEAVANEYLARDRMEAAPNNEAAKEEYNNARKVTEEKRTQYEAAKKLHKQIVLSGEAEEKFRKIIEGAVGEIIKGVKAASDLAGLVATMAETFGGSEEDVQFFKDIQDGLNSLSDGATNAVKAYAQFASGDIFGGISSAASAIGGIVSGVSSIFSAGKVKKANKEIKRQQQILEQLEYTYSRLEAKADKLFGRDYINNFKKQQENLEAQARAYKAQADAERSKGKKADEGKIKEYENAYRETMDKIADMQGKLAEQMTGSDIASSARDFANAWLEAYASFGNTAGAIKDKFKDMIKNMVVESVLAQTVQRSLQPMFDKIDEMYKQGASMTSVLAYAFEESNRRAEEINNALTIAAHRAEQAGVKLRGLTGSSSDFSGISRDIASASEESINGLAAGVNTQNYYMSYTPRIYDEVAALRAMLEKSYLGSAMSYHGGIDYTDIINISNQHLSSLPSIEANTAQTVKELQEVIGILRRVTIPKGGSAAYGVNVYMRN